ncbi:MarR family winged helix-turn-helix transcriptional regulator [Enterococcus faecium]|uniref:MarR family winged helix-turn-helix transcriptional regulator n=1 Tax=Enterococcus faecium TaxID=1352 RepID=UPI002DB67BBE|nr:MarR family winged helix-turn-helix transcriptional regulator [Enterococcus faecium]MCU1831703.1 MarR family winged helix-turn-helix transcriptional regulator [Enterococcus faecium]MEB6144319.1 MarR family winged helix-turn-helix transcriptional regulator [Enterococcus faecium]NTN71226.1 winged helix-turn-helix transcriptional regulator [Enterococcus faecium]
MNVHKNTVLRKDKIGIVRTIHDLDKILYSKITKNFEFLGISHIQGLVIIYLTTYKDKENYQIDLERAFGLSNPTMTASIKSMIQKKLLFKEKSKRDGRYYILSLTDAGMDLYQKCYEIYNTLEIEVDNILTFEEQETFKKIANKILFNFKAP